MTLASFLRLLLLPRPEMPPVPPRFWSCGFHRMKKSCLRVSFLILFAFCNCFLANVQPQWPTIRKETVANRTRSGWSAFWSAFLAFDLFWMLCCWERKTNHRNTINKRNKTRSLYYVKRWPPVDRPPEKCTKNTFGQCRHH